MVPGKSMAKGINSYHTGKKDHARFKPEIMDDINPENRKAGQEKGENGAMYRTGD